MDLKEASRIVRQRSGDEEYEQACEKYPVTMATAHHIDYLAASAVLGIGVQSAPTEGGSQEPEAGRIVRQKFLEEEKGITDGPAAAVYEQAREQDPDLMATALHWWVTSGVQSTAARGGVTQMGGNVSHVIRDALDAWVGRERRQGRLKDLPEDLAEQAEELVRQLPAGEICLDEPLEFYVDYDRLIIGFADGRHYSLFHDRAVRFSTTGPDAGLMLSWKERRETGRETLTVGTMRQWMEEQWPRRQEDDEDG